MTISVYHVIWLWFAHWVGDFVLQSDAMARGKSTSNARLSEHVCVYAVIIAWAVMLYDGAAPVNSRPWAVVFMVLNGMMHWLTDYVTSRINARLWTAGRVHDFFVGVGADQFIHLTTLVLTAWWLL